MTKALTTDKPYRFADITPDPTIDDFFVETPAGALSISWGDGTLHISVSKTTRPIDVFQINGEGDLVWFVPDPFPEIGRYLAQRRNVSEAEIEGKSAAQTS